jgi:two-component system nitrate/nitrite response regulator NarL
MSLSTKVIIYEPQVLLRQGIAKLLDGRLFDVVAETGCIGDIVELTKEHAPNIVILGKNSLEPEILQAYDVGVHGYLLKTFDTFSFNRSLNVILTGEQVFPLDVETNVCARDKLANLTYRERQILWHIANGLSNKQVGEDLKIAEGIVKVHVKSILKKLDIENRTQAAVYVHGKGVSGSL